MVGPDDRVIMSGEKERQGDFVFVAQEPGEYRACFDNEISTFTDKMVDFEIAVSLAGSPACRIHPVAAAVPDPRVLPQGRFRLANEDQL